MNDQPTEANPEYLSPDLSSEEVRKARGLEPASWICPTCKQGEDWGWCGDPDHIKRRGGRPSEQPKPVTPESLADEWLKDNLHAVAGNPFAVLPRLAFLAGYRANTERNADLAQRLDVAEEALKRNGFERGVVNGVPTWVRTDQTWIDEALARVCETDGVIARAFAEREQYRAENASLKTAASDYAKAAEASAALVEKLTRERDALRDTPSPVIAALEEERNTLRAELSAANEARENAERHRKALSQYLRAGSLDVDAYLGVYDERGSLKAAMEKERAEAERWKEEAITTCNAYAEQGVQLAEWQAVAGKMREFVERAGKRYGNMSAAGNIIEEARIFAADTSPATALLEALKGAWKEGINTAASFHGVRRTNAYDRLAWLASSTRKRYSGGTEAGAGEDASGGQPREDRAAPRQVPQTCDYMSPTYGCCHLPIGHEGCHIHKLSKP